MDEDNVCLGGDVSGDTVESLRKEIERLRADLDKANFISEWIVNQPCVCGHLRVRDLRIDAKREWEDKVCSVCDVCDDTVEGGLCEVCFDALEVGVWTTVERLGEDNDDRQ